MQKVEATVNPSRLKDISHALSEIGISDMTVYEERRAWSPKDFAGFDTNAGRREDMVPNVTINIVFKASLTGRVLTVIAGHATAFPFVFLNDQGIGSSSTNPQWQEPHVITESSLPLKCPPEPAL